MTEATKKASDPLTVEEVTAAAELFFPLFSVVRGNMPEGSSTEDAIKVMESVCSLAHKLRAEKKEEEKESGEIPAFGFNKKAD